MALSKNKINQIRNNFYSLNSKEEKLDYIINLYKHKYSVKDLQILFDVDSKKIFQILESFDVKKCSNPNCPNNQFQSRSNFHRDGSKPDQLSPLCKDCMKIKNINQKDKGKSERITNFTLNDVVNSYKEGYTIHNLSRLYNLTFEKIQQILKDHDIKKCSNPNCPNGQFQSRSNFYPIERKPDGLSDYCYLCKKYQDSNYLSRNKKLISKKNKKFRNSSAYFHPNAKNLKIAEETRRDPNNQKLIQVKCRYCDKWFNPTNQQVRSRILALRGQESSLGTQNHFYCSDECKNSCPTFRRVLYSKNKAIATSREVQSELRKLVFERDNWTCQKCYTRKSQLDENVALHCHHIEGIQWEPLESADIDMCMTVCSKCHSEIHKKEGCTYHDMKCTPEDQS